VPTATALVTNPLFIPMALIVFVALTLNVVQTGEALVGVVPLVVQ